MFADIDNSVFFNFLLAVIADRCFLNVLLIQRLTGECGPERRASAELDRVAPLDVASARRRCSRRCAHRTHRTEQYRAHLTVRCYVNLVIDTSIYLELNRLIRSYILHLFNFSSKLLSVLSILI